MMKNAGVLITLTIIWCGALLGMQPKDESENANVPDQTSLSQIVDAQENKASVDKKTTLESLKRWQNKGSFNSVLDMHNWYSKELQRITQSLPGQQKSFQLLSLKSKVKMDSIPKIDAKRKIRLGIAYHLPLNTTNFHFGINVFSNNRTDLWLYGLVGGGSNETKVFRYTNLTTGQLVNDRVGSNIGLGADYGISISPHFYGYLGVNINNVFMKNTSNGSNFNPYIGLRYFTPFKTPFYCITTDLKIGKPFWSGFQTVYGDHGPYLTGGITLISRKPFGLTQTPRTAPLETSLLYSLSINTISAKLAYPIRIYEQLSIAPTVHLGTDARTFQRLGSEISSFYSGGLDLRLYGDEMDKILNPYISYSYYFVEYDELGANIGEGQIVHVGNRFSLGKKFYLDVFSGPNFKNRKVRIVNSTNNIDELSSWDIGAGLTYSFGVEKTKREAKLSGVDASYIAYYGSVKELKDIPREHDVVSQAELNKHLNLAQKQIDAGEKEFQIKVEEERIYGIIEPEEPQIPNYGDLSDLKFFTVDLGMWLDINKRHKIPFLQSGIQSSEATLFIVLFDKKKVRVDRIKDTNMYLHFVDLQSGRYFGYRYDKNRRMQPEYQEKPEIVRDEKDGTPYYGQYKDFVRRLEWMTGNDFVDFMGNFRLSKDWMAKMIFDKMDMDNPTPDTTPLSSGCTYGDTLRFIADNYQIAYVKYPADIVNKLNQVCPEFGAQIMFRFDMNNNFDFSDSLRGHFLKASDVNPAQIACTDQSDQNNLSPETIISTDFDDCSYFSNIIPKIKFIQPEVRRAQTGNCEIRISGFETGKAVLTPDLKNELLLKLEEIDCGIPKIQVIGYVDASKYPANSAKKQQSLAEARANVVKNFLKEHFGDSVEIKGTVTYPGAKENDSNARCVRIIF